MGRNLEQWAWGTLDDWPADTNGLRYRFVGLAEQEIVAILDAGVEGPLLLAMLEDELDGHQALLCPRNQVSLDVTQDFTTLLVLCGAF
jgi:hypothetical protein